MIKATEGILGALVNTTDKDTDKATYDIYVAYLKYAKDTLEVAAKKEVAAKTKAVEDAKGGSLMWLWCILIGLVAIVGIFFLYRYCKNKDDKSE